MLGQGFARILQGGSSEPAVNLPIPVQHNDLAAIQRPHNTPMPLMAGENGMQSGIERALSMARTIYAPSASHQGGGGSLLYGKEADHFELPKADEGANFLKVHNE